MSSPSVELPAKPEVDELTLFESWCSAVLRLEDGSPMLLYPEQKVMLRDLFAGVREVLILIPKKNGKSTLLGALALYHLCTTPDAECVIAAASRDQAGIMLRQAQGFIRRSPALRARLRVKQREIIHDGLNGRIRILASDVDTADGVIPTLALVDELHRHKSPELYGVFADGLGPRDGQIVTISTAGDDDQSPLGELRRAAYALPGMEHEGAYHHVLTDNFAMHEWALDPEADRSDLKLVKLANPAPWQTPRALRQRMPIALGGSSPSAKLWQWARFACGVWVAGEDAAISDREWRKCSKTDVRIPEGAKGVVIGMDIGWKWDTTGIVPVWKPEGEDRFVVHPPVIVPAPRDGTATAEEDIWDPLAEFCEHQGWEAVTLVLDPNAGGEQLAQRADAELPGIQVATYSQMPQPMALAAQRMSDAISNGRLEHPDDPQLNAQVLAAAAKPVGEGFRLIKQRKKKLPIDAAIALAMAISVLVGEEEEPEYGRASW